MAMVDVMRELHNFFEVAYRDGEFAISADSVLTPVDALDIGQFIAVQGSKHNDGVYMLGDGGQLDDATPERFNGRVWVLYPPKDFIAACEEIEAYNQQNPANGYVSESFGGWSGTKATGAHGVLSWQEAFSARLRPYRRMFTKVGL